MRAQITPQEALALVNSGPLNKEWWDILVAKGIADRRDDWSITIREWNPDDLFANGGVKSIKITLDHVNISQTIGHLARIRDGDRPERMSTSVLDECRACLEHGEAISPDSADQIVQYLALGGVVYR